jgi:hypothetical protein
VLSSAEPAATPVASTYTITREPENGKSRLVINALVEQFRLFGLPALHRLN